MSKYFLQYLCVRTHSEFVRDILVFLVMLNLVMLNYIPAILSKYFLQYLCVRTHSEFVRDILVFLVMLNLVMLNYIPAILSINSCIFQSKVC